MNAGDLVLKCRRVVYEKAAIAASATAMSCSTVPALAPTAPTNLSCDSYGHASAEDDDFSGITFLYAEQGLAGLRKGCQSAVDLSNDLEVVALSMARSMLPIRPPS